VPHDIGLAHSGKPSIGSRTSSGGNSTIVASGPSTVGAFAPRPAALEDQRLVQEKAGLLGVE